MIITKYLNQVIEIINELHQMLNRFIKLEFNLALDRTRDNKNLYP